MPHPIPPALVGIFEDPYDVIPSNGILKTADPADIHRARAAFCHAHLNSRPAEVPYVTFSVGASFGMVPEDGRRAFLEAWNAGGHHAVAGQLHLLRSQHRALPRNLPGLLSHGAGGWTKGRLPAREPAPFVCAACARRRSDARR